MPIGAGWSTGPQANNELLSAEDFWKLQILQKSTGENKRKDDRNLTCQEANSWSLCINGDILTWIFLRIYCERTFRFVFFFFFPAKTLTWHPAIQSPPMSMSSSSCTLHIGDFMACLAHMKATICKSNQELSLKISVTSCCMMMLSFYHRASTWRFEYLK